MGNLVYAIIGIVGLICFLVIFLEVTSRGRPSALGCLAILLLLGMIIYVVLDQTDTTNPPVPDGLSDHKVLSLETTSH